MYELVQKQKSQVIYPIRPLLVPINLIELSPALANRVNAKKISIRLDESKIFAIIYKPRGNNSLNFHFKRANKHYLIKTWLHKPSKQPDNWSEKESIIF